MRDFHFKDSLGLWAMEWGAFFLLWLLFAFSLKLSELIAGALAAVAAVIATELVRLQPLVRARFRSRWLTSLWRLPFDALRESLLAYRFLLAQIFRRRSSTMTAFILHAKTDEPRLWGKRALAISVVSATPNSVVLGYDAEQDRLLIHQLYASPPPPILQVMGADKS